MTLRSSSQVCMPRFERLLLRSAESMVDWTSCDGRAEIAESDCRGGQIPIEFA